MGGQFLGHQLKKIFEKIKGKNYKNIGFHVNINIRRVNKSIKNWVIEEDITMDSQSTKASSFINKKSVNNRSFLLRRKRKNIRNIVISDFDLMSKTSLFPSKRLPKITTTFFEFDNQKKNLDNKFVIKSSLFWNSK